MIHWLIHHFIPHAEDVQNPAVRQRYGSLASIIGLICNAFLCLLKIGIGLLTHSLSIMADGMNNLSDGLSSLIALFGFRISNKEPDAKHPFGYGRGEYLAGFVVSFLILLVGFEFLKSSVERILHPEPVQFHLGLWLVLFASMGVKLWLGSVNRTIGEAISSATLIATMQDSLNDVISTAVVWVGMLASQYTPLPIDGYIGVAVALFILYSGVAVAKDTIAPLIGEAADPAVADQVKRTLCSMDGILDVHDLILHNYGVGKWIASIHAEVPEDANLVAIHEVIDTAERRVWKETGVYLVIHLDPVAVDNAKVETLKAQTLAVLQSLDERLSMHDFRLVPGTKHDTLVFDVLVPFDYDEAGKQSLRLAITQTLKQTLPHTTVRITLDHAM